MRDHIERRGMRWAEKNEEMQRGKEGTGNCLNLEVS